MKDYHGLYLKCDVLLLPDVFQKFRNNSLKNYGLCPSHYLSAPDLSLNLFQILICIFFEKSTKVQEVESVIFLVDTAKPTLNF